MKITRHDVIAPASFITLSGLVLVVTGSIQLDHPHGLILAVLGRCMDLLDGPVARATRTSRFGSALDATTDKFAILALLIAIIHFQLVPWVVIIYVTLHNLLNAIASTLAEKKGQGGTTPISGKLAMFFENLSLFAFVWAKLLQGSALLDSVAWVGFVLSLPLGIFASKRYLRRAKLAHHI